MRLSEKEIRKIVRKRILESMLLNNKKKHRSINESYRIQHKNIKLTGTGRGQNKPIGIKGAEFELVSGGKTPECVLLVPDNKSDPYYAAPISFLKNLNLGPNETFYKNDPTTMSAGNFKFNPIARDQAGVTEMNKVIAALKAGHQKLINSTAAINSNPNRDLSTFFNDNGVKKLYKAMKINDQNDTGSGEKSVLFQVIKKETEKFDEAQKIAASLGSNDPIKLANFQIDGKGRNIKHGEGASTAMQSLSPSVITDRIQGKTAGQLKNPDTWAEIFNDLVNADYTYLDLTVLSARSQNVPMLSTKRDSTGDYSVFNTATKLDLVGAIVFYLHPNGTDGRHISPSLTDFDTAFNLIINSAALDDTVKSKLQGGTLKVCEFVDLPTTTSGKGQVLEFTAANIVAVNDRTKSLVDTMLKLPDNKITVMDSISLDSSGNEFELTTTVTPGSNGGGPPAVKTEVPPAETPTSGTTTGTTTLSQSQTQFGHAEDPNAVGGITMKLSTASDTSVKTFEDLGYAPGLDKTIKRHLRGLVKNNRKFRGATIKMEVFYDKKGKADIKFHGLRDRLSTLQTSKLRREFREYINNSNFSDFSYEDTTGTHAYTLADKKLTTTLNAAAIAAGGSSSPTSINPNKDLIRKIWFDNVGKEKMMTRRNKHHVDVIIELY